MNIIRTLEQEQMRKDLPEFSVGDTVRVFVKVVEGSRERLQAFEGLLFKETEEELAKLYSAQDFLWCWCRENFSASFTKD